MTLRTLLLVALATFAVDASADTLADAYWSVRERATARLAALAHADAKPAKIRAVEDAALRELERRVIAMVGPVAVEGYATLPTSHVVALAEGPDFGLLDGVSFAALGARGGELLVTTETLLDHWLKTNGPKAAALLGGLAALRSDAFYSDAFNPENGVDIVADLALKAPPGASLIVAKFGRFGWATDTPPHALLIVSVVRDGKIFVAVSPPKTKISDIAACPYHKLSDDPDEFGPYPGDDFEAWRTCERRNLSSALFYVDLRREAQQLAERLAPAK